MRDQELIARLITAGISLGVVLLAIAAIVIAVRWWRRSARARAAAVAARHRAAVAIARFDDVSELWETEVAVSGAMTTTDAASRWRRARMTAQHNRDDLYARFAALDAMAPPAAAAAAATTIERHAQTARAASERARAQHAEWSRSTGRPAARASATATRLADARRTAADVDALVRDLATRADETEWRDAATAVSRARVELDRADEALRAAASSPDRLDEALADAERAVRRAIAAARALEDTHRTVLSSGDAVAGELVAIREALHHGSGARRHVADTARLDAELAEIAAAVDDAERDAARRPTATVEHLAHLHGRLDGALGTVRTPQQRLRDARTALPGSLATARLVIARVEAAAVDAGDGIDPADRTEARAGLRIAEQRLADARQAGDPFAALSAAREAIAVAARAERLLRDGAGRPAS